jgi:hypothetical protein
MKSLREKPWNIRVALLLVAVWAIWLLAFNVWSWNVSELRSGDVYIGYTVVSAMAAAAVLIGLVAAIWRPGTGAVAGGLVVTGVAAIGCAYAVNGLAHWGELVDDVPDRTTPWVPLDSIGALPFAVLLASGIVLLIGGIAHVRHASHGTTPHAGATA